MVILNFSHPLTEEQIAQIESLSGEKVERVIDIPTHFDNEASFGPQVVALVDSLGFSPQEWQTTLFLINPPSLNIITAVLLAELHGRMGYFPTIIRLRPVPGSPVPRFEVAELLTLQQLREEARKRRM